MSMNILDVKNINVEMGGIKILDSISFSVEEGEVFVIIGPNGAGKTVLLKSLLGLVDYNGEIKWAPDVKIGYVPQRLDIDSNIPLTVEEFLRLRSKKITKDKIKEVLGYMQLDEKILKLGFGEISVGQRQRILIAWAVLGNPSVLLFDEPTADIDIAGQESIYNLIKHLQEKMNLTIILVSHDLSVVYRYAQKVLCLNKKNICVGAPSEVINPDQLAKLYGSERAFYHHNHFDEGEIYHGEHHRD